LNASTSSPKQETRSTYKCQHISIASRSIYMTANQLVIL
jgi:hypothetical protein